MNLQNLVDTLKNYNYEIIAIQTTDNYSLIDFMK